jgi:hypothetical protein
MFKLVKYIVGGLIACSTPLAAGGLPPEVADSVMNSCRADYHRVCPYVVPGDGRVGRCLLDHERELEPPCLKAVKLAYAMEVCLPDYQRFCNGVQPGGGQIVQCLAERIEALAPECQRVVSANAPYAAPGEERYGYYRDQTPYPGAYPYRSWQGGAERYSEGDHYSQGDRYSEGDGYSGRPYDDRYADHGYDRYRVQPYGYAPNSARGDGNPDYAPAPEEEREPVK